MKASSLRKRHFSKCLFFVALLGLSLQGLASEAPLVERAEALSLSTDCLRTLPRQPVRIDRVTDGDTVVLDDGRRVRLIGLNTLELNAPDEHDRQMAVRARDALGAFLAGQRVLLIPGIDTHDQHGRTLAHIRRGDGQDAAHSLVRQGLGMAVAIGANTRCAASLLALEHEARSAGIGLWAERGTWYLNKPLRGTERGFHVARGRVIQVSGRGSKTTLLLDNGLSIRLGKNWPGLHVEPPPSVSLAELIGLSIQVRGWLGTSSGKPLLTLHHPLNLETMTID